MIRYTVTAVIQSQRIDGNLPVDVNWYTGDNLAKALAALTAAAAHDEDVDSGDLPEEFRYRTLSVRLDKEVLPDPDTLTYRIDWPEGHAWALSDCCWWDNQYQPWTRVECSGRMAVVTMVKNGQDEMATPMCEGHVNAYNDGALTR